MRDAMRKVAEFHRKYGFPIGHDVTERFARADVLRLMGADLRRHARDLYEGEPSVAEQRAGLMMEELGELVEGLSLGDPVLVADALADLSYVVLGTAVAFDSPLPALFDDVHESNMTKEVGGLKPFKGEDYRPPETTRILREHHMGSD